MPVDLSVRNCNETHVRPAHHSTIVLQQLNNQLHVSRHPTELRSLGSGCALSLISFFRSCGRAPTSFPLVRLLFLLPLAVLELGPLDAVANLVEHVRRGLRLFAQLPQLILRRNQNLRRERQLPK